MASDTSEVDIRFSGPEYDGAEEQLGDFAEKLIGIVNDVAIKKFGETALRNPSDIEIVPAILGEPLYVVTAWHEQGEGEAKERHQYHDFSFKVVLDGDDALIETEEAATYPVNTRETLLLAKLANIAYIRSQLGDAPAGEGAQNG